MKKLTLTELSEKNNWKEAVIVFTKDSFNKPYTEVERSYEVSSDNKYFHTDKISTSLYGDCLDGTEHGVRLDVYMNSPKKEDRWKIDYCYIP